MKDPLAKVLERLLDGPPEPKLIRYAIRLVYSEANPFRRQADARGRWLKGWIRLKQRVLIDGTLGALKQL